jgi:N6-adenosine-specific RNA methylase IME4
LSDLIQIEQQLQSAITDNDLKEIAERANQYGKRALMISKTVEDKIELLSQSKAFQEYIKKRVVDKDKALIIQNEFAELYVLTQWEIGKYLKDMEKQAGARGSGSNQYDKKEVASHSGSPPKISDLGIERHQSSRYQQIALIPEEEFKEEVHKIKESGEQITSNHFLNIVKKREKEKKRKKKAEKINETIKNNKELNQDKKYAVIYADPPWEYEHCKTDNRKIENHYPTMSLDKIKELPVNNIVFDDSILFLWATSPKLEEAIQVINSWGFNYRTCAVWDKQKIGMGYYFRQQHELLLVATKGELPVPIPENRVSSVLSYSRGKHSEKPEEIYNIIDKMYPEYEKIELFARRNDKNGWEAWGNESNS